MNRNMCECLNERNILAELNSPFVVGMKYAFTTTTELVLVLDLMVGGDLHYLLKQRGKFSAAETRYYAVRMLLGVAALHDKGLVYRDLKPQNVMIDEDGSTRISDLGVAIKCDKSGLSGVTGTRGYWAPEMLRQDEHGKRERYFYSADWFSFGCCVYELLAGICPFHTEKAMNYKKDKILQRMADSGTKLTARTSREQRHRSIDLAVVGTEPDYDPAVFDEVTIDLLRRLLDKDRTTRLGAGQSGYKEIMAHPYFAGIDWQRAADLSPPSGSRGVVCKRQAEVGRFCRKADDSGELQEDELKYKGWHFVNEQAFEEEVAEYLMFEEKNGALQHKTAEVVDLKCSCAIS